MPSLLQWIHIISFALIVSRSTQSHRLATVNKEDTIILKHGITDKISSLLLVKETGLKKSLTICHCHTPILYHHSHTHIACSHIVFTTVSMCLYSQFAGPTFQEKASTEKSLMTPRSCLFLWSVPVAFGSPIYVVALTKPKSSIERTCPLPRLGWVTELNGYMLWWKAYYWDLNSDAVM